MLHVQVKEVVFSVYVMGWRGGSQIKVIGYNFMGNNSTILVLAYVLKEQILLKKRPIFVGLH